MARIYVSIDKNGFSYLNTTDYQGASGPRKSSKGTIHVINFETDDVVKLAGCEPTAMLEMPLKLIVWNDGKNAFIGYTNANHFKKRYLVSECDEVIKNINRSLIRVVNDAIRTH